MAETTSQKAKMSRDETAALLRSIADELESDRGIVRVRIGNKEVRLSPPDTIDAETTVTERSRRLRKNVEELDLEFTWNPVKDTVRSGSDDDSGETDGAASDEDPGSV